MKPHLVVTFTRLPRKGPRCQIGRGPYRHFGAEWPFATEFVDVAMPWSHRTENDALKVAGDYVSRGDAEDATVWWSGDKKWAEVATVRARVLSAGKGAGRGE